MSLSSVDKIDIDARKRELLEARLGSNMVCSNVESRNSKIDYIDSEPRYFVLRYKRQTYIVM